MKFMSPLMTTMLSLSLLMVSCRPPQEATEYNITDQIGDGNPGVDKDGTPIDGSGDGQGGEGQKYLGVEEFTQSSYGQIETVDIVWVIDNSGSMEDEQTALQQNFDSFINKFVQNGQSQYPFKMAVTTTEAYRTNENKDYLEGDNCFPGSPSCIPYDLSSEAAEDNLSLFIDDFKNAVGRGINGSGYEKSLYSAFKISEKYPNFFIGNNNLLVVIPVSDEQEQSHVQDGAYDPTKAAPLLDENGEQYTIAKWVSKFQQLKPDNPGLVKFFPIVRLNPVPGEDGDGDVGDRYLEMANLTGGQRYDIDQPFDNILDDLGNSIVNLLKSFLLKGDRNIDSSTIIVRVNGVIRSDWVYQNKAIRFTNPPAEGSIIKVTYQYQK